MAAAADLVEQPSPIVVDDAMFDWTGFYVGAHAGWATGTVRIDDAFCINVGDCGPNPDNRYFSEPALSGWQLGGHVGAQQQIDMMVLGVETDLNWTNVSGTDGFHFYDADSGDTGDGNPIESSEFAMTWDGSARVKVGVAIDRFMPYATAGIAYGQADIATHREFGNAQDINDPLRELDFTHSVTLIGYTVGIGGAYAVTDNMFVHAEGRYTEYGEVDSSSDFQPDDNENLVIAGPKLFNVRGGVSFKF